MTAIASIDLLIVDHDGNAAWRNSAISADGSYRPWQGKFDQLPSNLAIAIANIPNSHLMIVAAPQLKGVVSDGNGGIKLVDLVANNIYYPTDLLAITADMNLQELP